MSKLLPVRLKRNAIRSARYFAPIDTGNLRYNAIRGELWSNRSKFRIVYDTQSATYIEPLNEGWLGNKGRHFIEEAVQKITSDLITYYESGKFAKKQYMRNTPETHMRIARHAESLATWRFAKSKFEDLESKTYNREVN